MKPLFNHSSFETAFLIPSYPYGRLRCKKYVWLETVPKKGDRLCEQTENPKTGRLNAVKKSTFVNLGCLYLDANNYIQWTGLTIYSKQESKDKFIEFVGGVENLNEEQLKQWKQLNGEKLVKYDDFTGEAKKDFAVKWEKDRNGKYVEVRITFDRPDGVTLLEIFKAMKGLNKDKLNEVFETREAGSSWSYTGKVTICTRGGNYLGAVKEEEFKNFLASDINASLEIDEAETTKLVF